MKIAFFANTILEHAGGFEKYLTETAHALSVRYPACEITIVTFNEQRTEWLQHLLTLYYGKKMPVENIYREKTEHVLARLGRVRYVKCGSFSEVRDILKAQDVLYVKNEIIDLAILRLFVWTTFPPMVVGVHTPLEFPRANTFHAKLHNFLYNGPLYAFLLRQASAVHVITSSAETLVKRLGFSGAIFRIANPFLAARFSYQENTTDELRILSIGRVSEEKGLGIFIECIRGLLRTEYGPSLRVKIAGMGDEKLVATMIEMGRETKQVDYLGYIQNEHIHELYEWTDLVLIPSYFETMPYTVLETGASGKVVVASDIPGIQDMILPGETGFLVPLSVEAFVAKVQDLFHLKRANRASFQAIGMKAMAHVAEKFNPEEIYGELYQMLEATAVKR